MNGLRKGQAICNKLYELQPAKNTKGMGLIEFEDYILEHKAELFDLLYNMSDEKFDEYFNNLIK